jgi:SynChlorMet cassette radical SAM/SPASM protein ScmF
MSKEHNNDRQKIDSAEKFPLKQIYFYLTEGCNLACSHCWIAPKYDPMGDQYPVLPISLFKKVIDEAKPLGLTGVKLTGGEPLLHPDFLAMLEIISKEKIELYIETNGLLCSSDIAKTIGQLNNPFVSVSIDGADAPTHDRIRGVSGAFEKATSAVKHLADNGVNPQVIMSIMQSNADQVEAVIELAEDLGADSVKLNIIQPTGRGEAIRNSASGLHVKDLLLLGQKVETELAAKTKMKLFFDYPLAFRSLSHIATGDGCGICSILSILGVLPSGDYALCGIGSHVEELIFGTADKDLLIDVWHENQVLKQLRSGLPERLTGICFQCLMKHYCFGSCIAQNYYRKHSLWAPFWFCELAEAEGLFPKSRLNTL